VTRSGSGGLGRTSGVIAAGILASRVSGFARTVVLAAALGVGALAQAYTVAYTVPFVLYDLLLGGLLTSVVVPVLVQAAKDDPDEGQAFAASLLTLIGLGLGAAVLAAAAGAPLLVDLYLAEGGRQADLATAFLRLFLPQVALYGVGAALGAVLNTRGRFGAPTAAPVLNNLLVIATALVFIALPGPRPPTPDGITTTQVLVLGLGSTGGVLLMTLALLPSLRAAGFRYRPRLEWRHPGLRRAVRLAGWMLVYVVTGQVGFLVVVRLASDTTSLPTYSYAYQIFQLPHAVLALSVITALLPRMSRHAADGRPELIRKELSTGVRLAAVALLPSALGLVVLGRPLAVAVFDHGATSAAEAARIGSALMAFGVALPFYSAFQLQLRAFYAMQDSRTPALVNLAVVGTNLATAVGLAALLPDRLRAVGLAAAFGLGYAAGLALTTRLLHRRLAGLDGPRVRRTLARVLVAALPAGAAAGLVAAGVRAVAGGGPVPAGAAVALGGTAGAAVYAAAALRLGIPELSLVLGRMAGRLRR
jgi:putative peptidoglycan lipid II flippase